MYDTILFSVTILSPAFASTNTHHTCLLTNTIFPFRRLVFPEHTFVLTQTSALSYYQFIVFHQGCPAYSRCKYSPGHPVFSCIGAVRLSFIHSPYTFPRTCRSFTKLVNLAGFPIFLALVCAVLFVIIEHTSYLSYCSFHFVPFFF